MGERIRQARKQRGMTQDDLAKATGGLSRNAVSMWEKDVTQPSTGNLKTLTRILGVDLLWITDGEVSPQSDVRRVPIVSWVSAGRLSASDCVESWQDLPSVAAAGLPDGDWMALRVEGSSMDRVAPPGSLIFVNRRDRDLLPGRDYVFSTPEGATLKRWRANPSRLEPFSTFPEYETIFPEGQIKVVGRVCRVQHDL